MVLVIDQSSSTLDAANPPMMADFDVCSDRRWVEEDPGKFALAMVERGFLRTKAWDSRSNRDAVIPWRTASQDRVHGARYGVGYVVMAAGRVVHAVAPSPASTSLQGRQLPNQTRAPRACC